MNAPVTTLSMSSRFARLLPQLATLAAIVILWGWHPDMAFAQDLAGKADKALEWIKTGVHAILIVAVIGSGVLAAFGRMSWPTVGQVLIGSIIAGVATEVVDALYQS